MSESIFRVEIHPQGEQRFILDSAVGNYTKEDLGKMMTDLDRNGSLIMDLPLGGYIAVPEDQVRTVLLVPVELLQGAEEVPVDVDQA